LPGRPIQAKYPAIAAFWINLPSARDIANQSYVQNRPCDSLSSIFLWHVGRGFSLPRQPARFVLPLRPALADIFDPMKLDF
jgi:hypothetical protein